MPRNLRIDFRGAVHHVVNRGQNGRNIFLKPGDRDVFLNFLDIACMRHGCTLHTWAFMPNHFHAVITSGEEQLSATIGEAKSRYTQWVNHREGWNGTLFAGRFFNKVVLDPRYLQAVLLYVTTNPQRSTLGRQDSWTGRHRLAQGDRLLLEAFGTFDIYENHETGVLEHPDLATLELLPSHPRGQTTGIVGCGAQRFNDVLMGLNRLAHRTKSTPGEILRPASGVRNTEGQLLTWYLVTCSSLSHREIAEAIGIKPRTVTSRAARIDREVLQDTTLGRTALELAAGTIAPAQARSLTNQRTFRKVAVGG